VPAQQLLTRNSGINDPITSSLRIYLRGRTRNQTSAGSCQSLSNTESQTLGRPRDQNRAMSQVHFK
jgi:hypothetical protein